MVILTVIRNEEGCVFEVKILKKYKEQYSDCNWNFTSIYKKFNGAWYWSAIERNLLSL